MAQVVQLTILQRGAYALKTPEVCVFPVTSFIAVPATGTAAGQTVHSQINVFPTGLNQPTVKMLCAETITAIAAAANAPLA